MRLLVSSSFKMIVRDRQSVFWALAFPLIFLTVFRLFSFDTRSATDLVVSADVDEPRAAALVRALEGVDFLHVEQRPGLDETTARQLLKDGDFDAALLVTQGSGPTLQAQLIHGISDPIGSAITVASIESLVDRVDLALSGQPRAISLTSTPVDLDTVTYFQFLGPGIIGMGLMTFATISLAGSLSRYREEGVLRRVRATPLAPWRFFAGVLSAHGIMAVVQIVVLSVYAELLGADVLRGGIPFLLVAAFGTLIFMNIGVIIAGRVRGRGAVEGAANAVTLPTMFLSGAFFPVEGMPRVVQVAVQALPLTHMLHALRGMTIERQPVWDQWPALLVMTAWVVGTLVVARMSFSLSDA